MIRILIVCSANICRSPYGAALFHSGAVLRGLDVSVLTAGTDALEGDSICRLAGARLGEIEATHSSRPLRADLIAESDLVLTAEQRHRAVTVTMLPRAHAKVFTLLEAASLATFVEQVGPQESFESWMQSMAAARGLATGNQRAPGRWRNHSLRPDRLDILDGHGSGKRVHGRALDLVAQATERLLDTLPGQHPR